MANTNKLKLSFYGDDITGSTDSMEALVLAGIPTVLFLEPPTIELVKKKFPHIQAVGLAGMSRTMTPEEMDEALPAIFLSLKELDTPITHYKICSTFDSSPEIGSIGRAAEIGLKVFRSDVVPVAVGAPKLRRFVVFGNLFATLGGQTYRLDRHPVMSKHPVTPMNESDLRRHLTKQTDMRIGLIDVNHLAKDDDAIRNYFRRLGDEGNELIILDTLNQRHLVKIGKLIWELGQETQTFVVGSSGVEFALAGYWHDEQVIHSPPEFGSPRPVDTVVAMSGSASPWTATQIHYALEMGFKGLRVDGSRLVDPETQGAERQKLVETAVQILSEGQSVILYSALGPDDLNIHKTKMTYKEFGLSSTNVGEFLGVQQGMILKEILSETGLKRAAVAGGDTCGYVLKQLSVYVLEFITPLGKATPLCLASSKDHIFDGVEIALKGGQLGDKEFFVSLRNGT